MESGQVISFNRQKGFGFIIDQYGYKYFFHISNVHILYKNDITKGSYVRFDDEFNTKGRCAKNICIDISQQNFSDGNYKHYNEPKEKFLKIEANYKSYRIQRKKVKGYFTHNVGDDVFIIIEMYGEKNKKIYVQNWYEAGLIIDYLDKNV